MHIVSYRGPGMAGGVSAALARAWESNLGSGGQWWHIADDQLKVASGPRSQAEHVANVPEEVIKGHYRFCNEFLWPIMHDLPQYVNYVPEDRAYYDLFNNTLGWCLIRAFEDGMPRDYFVQDYQLTFLPQFLKEHAGFRSMMFWHIPWPKHVAAEHVEQIATIARGMLGASAIGFHTDEYAENFGKFVAAYIPEFSVSEDGKAIWSTETIGGQTSNVRRIGLANTVRNTRGGVGGAHVLRPTTRTHVTRLVTAPLGIDFDHWQSMSRAKTADVLHPALSKTPYILSVDRADYTKGVIDRIHAIDLLFQNHPEWIGRITFAQICGKTRTGLQSFDGYWDESYRQFEELTAKYGNDGWKPMHWIQTSFSSAELAKVYRNAEGMLVNAVRDGLNLTAKEFVACQDRRGGVLALSKGTGAHYELGHHTVALEPGNRPQIAEALHQSLNMSAHERQWRMAMLKEKVKANSLSGWWHRFTQMMHQEDGLDELLSASS